MKPAHEFLSIPLVRNQIALAGQVVGREAATAFETEMDQRIEMNADVLMVTSEPLAFDSPLELAFWIWWMAARDIDHFCREDLDLLRHVEIEHAGGHYVLDFVVAPSRRAKAHWPTIQWPLVGVELDGHAFHETTLEQVTARNQRDRVLQQLGWKVFHFSFAEFTREPEISIWEVVEYARTQHLALVRDVVRLITRADSPAHDQKGEPVGDSGS